MGRWARLENQSAGVRPTARNTLAQLSQRPERTAQHLLLLQPWPTAAHETLPYSASRCFAGCASAKAGIAMQVS
jgi:hypothetical protein